MTLLLEHTCASTNVRVCVCIRAWTPTHAHICRVLDTGKITVSLEPWQPVAILPGGLPGTHMYACNALHTYIPVAIFPGGLPSAYTCIHLLLCTHVCIRTYIHYTIHANIHTYHTYTRTIHNIHQFRTFIHILHTSSAFIQKRKYPTVWCEILHDKLFDVSIGRGHVHVHTMACDHAHAHTI